MKLPVIDERLFESDPDQFRDRVSDALHTVGFFALSHHSVGQVLLEDSYYACQKLFDLTTEQKLKYRFKNGQRGYTPYLTEHAKDQSAPDLKEFWHVGREDQENLPANLWPDLADFQDTVLNLYAALERSSLKILSALAKVIDYPALPTITQGGDTILRLIHYPALDTAPPEGSMRASAHEDINLITLLVAATAEGLQLKTTSGEWIDAEAPEGTIVVDSGDMLQNLSNGFYRSTTHRVINPKDFSIPRYSMPYFVHPIGSADLTPLSHLGDEPKYPSITAGQYLQQRLAEIGLT